MAVARKLRAARCSKVVWIATLCAPISLASAQQQNQSYTQDILAIQTQMQSGDLAGARAAIVQAQKRYPANGGLENLLGVIEVQQGNAGTARQDFLNAVRHDPHLASAYLNLSRIDLQTGAQDPALRAEALRMSERVLAMDSANDEARYQVARIYALDDQNARSLAALERLSPQARASLEVQVLTCQVRASLSDRTASSNAVRALAQNTDLTEQDAAACIPNLRTAHRADLIVELLTASAARTPLSPAGLELLGLAYEAQGQPSKARTTLEQAFTARPDSFDILIDLTRVARAAGDDQGALGYLAHARDLRPKDATLAYEFAVICVQMGLHMEARKALGEALAIDPDNPEYNLAMGTVISYATNPVEAMSYLKKYQSLRPHDPNGLLALGITCFKLDDTNAAISWLKQAAAEPSTAGEAHYYLGRIERSQAHLNEAMNEFEESLRFSPDQPNTLAELGQTAFLEHNNEEAARYLERALKLDPDNYLANFGLMQLYARTKDPRAREQEARFNQVKDNQDQRESQSRRLFEIRRDGISGDATEPTVRQRPSGTDK